MACQPDVQDVTGLVMIFGYNSIMIYPWFDTYRKRDELFHVDKMIDTQSPTIIIDTHIFTPVDIWYKICCGLMSPMITQVRGMIMMIPNEFSHGKWPIEIEVYLLKMGGFSMAMLVITR